MLSGDVFEMPKDFIYQIGIGSDFFYFQTVI